MKEKDYGKSVKKIFTSFFFIKFKVYLYIVKS